MLGQHVAQQLKAAGLAWKPQVGDRFAIPDRDLDDESFVLSDMTIQVHDRPEGLIIGFNGTTEWALDDVDLDEALWLPREDQLRALLGGTFRSMHKTKDTYSVRTELLDHEHVFTAPDADEAYAAALLHLLGAVA
ncbi:pilus assembly protein CpaE [Actinoplanes derwentensis]|uniref:Pilus assembly protein CpaE n=1 Tax=Actinoplanes derwentensis TaxID=113562 RepID=A0A1H2D220_9ACTN|nr:pilus assembly protein CpaE [Actinoplanes derwentensis]GID86847.1 hypothetical protein Ade03nite_57710 [Actinoplanes derwentensis]SDT76781.1 hypothetical protein SAMN04489716_7729 [Actinoplanes derwentensis]